MASLIAGIAKDPNSSSPLLDAAWKKYKQNVTGGGIDRLLLSFSSNPNISRALAEELVEYGCSTEPTGLGDSGRAVVRLPLMQNPGCDDQVVQALVIRDGELLKEYDQWAEHRQDPKKLVLSLPWKTLQTHVFSFRYDCLDVNHIITEALNELDAAELTLFFDLETTFEGTGAELFDTVKAVLREN